MKWSKSLIILLFLLPVIQCLSTEIRSFWVMPWNLTNKKQIDDIVEDAYENNFTEILAEVRYRADALYIPNKNNKLYANPEPRSYVLRDDDFDPLQYLLEKAHSYDIEVQAWVPLYNVVPTNKDRMQSNFIVQNHSEWIMTDIQGNRMNGNKFMGYFIDPGVPAVKNHLLNVLLDIVVNYPELDGIHLDYVRYPAPKYGYSKESTLRYNRYKEEFQRLEWNDWRIMQIRDFICDFRDLTKGISSKLLITAAVIADIHEAKEHYAQDWVSWLNSGIIDRAYPMAYAKDYSSFKRIISSYNEVLFPDKIVLGLRAWQENYSRKDYSVDSIIEKAYLSRQNNFGGIALFSYEGIKKSGFMPDLKASLFNWQDKTHYVKTEDDFITNVTRSSYLQESIIDSLKYNRKISIIESVAYKSGIYHITLYFENDVKCNISLFDETGRLIYKESKHYPKGIVVDEWDGFIDNDTKVISGIYTLKLTSYDNDADLIDEKKFIVY